MATKGTKYSDVNFSVPEGADPLGIGVPDLGRSSYDPIATIRSGWMKSREERFIKDEQRRSEYQSFMEDLPTYEAINQKVASKLNEKVMEMGQLAHQRYESGSWSPFAKTEEGASTERELARKQSEIITEGPAYNAMLPKYKAAHEYLSDPENFEKLDMDLTRENMSAFTEAEDIDQMTKAWNKPFLVKKPEPVELNKYLQKLYDQYIPGEDKDVVSKVYNEKMNKWEVKERTYKNPQRVIVGMRKIYRNMEDKYRNEVDRRFKDLSGTQKAKHDTAKDWFISQYVPEYGQEIDYKTYAGKGDEVNWGHLPQKGSNGRLDLSEHETVEQMGVKVGETEGGGPEIEDREFNSAATLGLQSISRMPFVMENSPGTRRKETGEKAPPGRSTTHLMDHISIMPVATEQIQVEMGDGTTKMINAGDLIPKNVQRQMAKNPGMLGKMKWDAYLTTLASNKQVSMDRVMAGINLGQDISSFTETQIRPWREASKYISGAAREKDIDIKPLEEKIENILNQLNNPFERIMQESSQGATEDEYESYFGAEK